MDLMMTASLGATLGASCLDCKRLSFDKGSINGAESNRTYQNEKRGARLN
nr:MAG TPA: hypothetical protein [Caudoviricetes sp.]